MSFIDNMAHHWDVLKAAWKEEKQKEASPQRQDRARNHEMAFLPAALEVMETPASPLGRYTALAIMAFFVIATGWAIIGDVDIIANAQGKIIPSAHVKSIQPLETGIVRAIHVQDGQSVKKGDKLIELDPTDTEADRSRLKKQYDALRVEMARLTALLNADPIKTYLPPDDIPDDLIALHRSYLESQIAEQKAERLSLEGEANQKSAEIRTIKANIKRLQKVIPSIRQRVNAKLKLVEKGIATRMLVSELEQELFNQEGQLEVEKEKLAEAEAALNTTTARLNHLDAEFRRDIHAQLSEARDEAQSIEQEFIKAADRHRKQALISPVDGTVQQMEIHTVGGVVTPAQVLMIVVPANSKLEIEAMVLNKDIGFVKSEQAAELKVESFPFTKYGVIDGTVLHVSADAVQDEDLGLVYPARVSMARTKMLVNDKWVNLTPGMNVTVEIKTGKRKIIEFLLAPLQRYQDESMRER